MNKKEEEEHKEKNKKEEGKGYDEFWLQYDQKDEEACKTMAESSPFGKVFKKIHEKEMMSKNNGKDRNKYCLPEFIRTLVVFYMPLTPLWTGMLLYSDKNRKTR